VYSRHAPPCLVIVPCETFPQFIDCSSACELHYPLFQRIYQAGQASGGLREAKAATSVLFRIFFILVSNEILSHFT